MPAGSAHVFAIPAVGGQPKPLGQDLAAAMYPVWSANGDRVLVVGRMSANTQAEPDPDWWVTPATQGASAATGVLKKLMQDPRTLRAPSWQYTIIPQAWRKSGEVLFTAQNGDAVNLWSIDLDPSGKARRITEGVNSETGAAFAGDSLFFASSTLRFDIWAIPLDGEHGDLRKITDDLSSKMYPTISWDGSKLAYTSRHGAEYSMTIRDLASAKEVSLLTSGHLLTPRLSGNGQWLTYGEYGSVLRILARGGAVERLCEHCGRPTSVSFDGGRILLEPIESPEDIRAMDVASRKITTLAPARAPLFNGEWSRDGKWVAFSESKGPASSQIFIAPMEGGAWLPITTADASYKAPQWSAAGNVLYFLSDRDGFRCVWAQRLNAVTKAPEGPLFAVQHFHHARRSLQHQTRFDDSIFTVGPGMALVVVGELTGNIWMRERKSQ